MSKRTDTPQFWAFPGLHYFEDNEIDRKLFFGREQEIEQLAQRILAEDLTVLFGKSGEGKTSLINAGLKKALRELGYLPVRARVFNVAAKQTPLDALYQDLAQEAQTNRVPLPEHWQKPTLWETFMALRPSAENKLKPIVLILDQFEELFTLMAGRPEEQEEFIRQFADLVRGRIPEELRETYRAQLRILPPESAEARELEKLLYATVAPPVRILLSLREDYLALLDRLSSRIPKVFGSRYRLPSLSIEQAREAITHPPQQTVLGEAAFSIAPEAVEAMLEFLTAQSWRLGGSEELVGPPQLQVLCRQLEEQMRAAGKHEISVADLGGEKGMRHMLSRYYRSILAKFPRLRVGPGPRRLTGLGVVRRVQPMHSPRFAVRRLCEERLITAGGNRNSRHEDEIIREIGVAENDLQQLVDSRLLRREPRLQESFYELSHDSLVPSLQTAGGLRKRWVTGLKSFTFVGLVFAVIYWGVPFVKGFFAMDTLQAEFEAVKEGKMSAGYFRDRLRNMREFVPDSSSLKNLHDEFAGWRKDQLEQNILATNTSRTAADSLLLLFKIEYPIETAMYDALSDSLYQRALRQVELRYNTFVSNAASDTSALANAQALLDSVQAQFVGNVRFTDIRADLARRQNRLQEQERLEGISRIFRQLANYTIQEVVKLRQPRFGIVKGDTLGKTTSAEIVLENNPILQKVSLFLNDKPMKLQTPADEKQRYFTGIVQVPPRGAQMEITIKAIEKTGNQVSTTFPLRIDREPPRLLAHKIFFRENEKEAWQSMPSGEWRGKEWRIEAQASEPLQSASAVLVLYGLDMKMQRAASLTDEIVPGKLANDARTAEFTTSSTSILSAQEIEGIVRLQDVAGWQNSISMGKWKVAKAPAQEVQPAAEPNAPPEKFLSAEEVKALIVKNDFYCADSLIWSNPKGKGIKNSFILESKGLVVYDRTTAKRWQQTSAREFLAFADAQEYVKEMNRKSFAGYEDWRLPTLEEAMSLIEPRQSGGLYSVYSDKIFERVPWFIWTSEKFSSREVWVADFNNGVCFHINVAQLGVVRLVR